MRLRFATLCLLVLAFALPGNLATRAAGLDATTIIEFDLVKGTTGQLIATYTKNPDGTWSGVHPATRAPMRWTADATGHSLVLYTDGPPITTMVVDTDTYDISSSALNKADRCHIGRAVFAQ